jgi:hypothetical protein
MHTNVKKEETLVSERKSFVQLKLTVVTNLRCTLYSSAIVGTMERYDES